MINYQLLAAALHRKPEQALYTIALYTFAAAVLYCIHWHAMCAMCLTEMFEICFVRESLQQPKLSHQFLHVSALVSPFSTSFVVLLESQVYT